MGAPSTVARPHIFKTVETEKQAPSLLAAVVQRCTSERTKYKVPLVSSARAGIGGCRSLVFKESGGRASRFEDPLLPVTGEGMKEASREGNDQGLPPGRRVGFSMMGSPSGGSSPASSLLSLLPGPQAGSDPLVRHTKVLPGDDTSDVVGPAVACCFVLPDGGRKVQRVAHSCMRQHGRQANQRPTETLGKARLAPLPPTLRVGAVAFLPKSETNADRLLIEETIHVVKYRYFDMCQVPAPAHPLLAHLFNVEVKVTMARPETCADSRLLLASWQERQHRIDASSLTPLHR